MDAHQTTLFHAILIAGGIIGCIIIYFVISLVRHQRKNQELYKSKILAEVSAIEKERQRISADLHDELGPVLASVKLKLSSLDLNSKQDEETVDKMNNNLDDIIGRLRDIANDLMPNILVRKGLVIAMQNFIEKILQAGTLEIQFTHGSLPDLPLDKSIHLYRIILEILHNTIKHAGASLLRIELKADRKILLLLTEDNGCGFDESNETVRQQGFGLRNLLTRTDVLAGTMYLHTKPDKGTSYIFEFPL
jgi:signal transduction histidine kinase